MASKVLELIAMAVLPGLALVGRAQLTEQLDEIYASDPEAYKSAVQGAYIPLKRLLEPLIKKTKTKIDDTLFGALIGALEDSASNTGTTLPDVSDAPEVPES